MKPEEFYEKLPQFLVGSLVAEQRRALEQALERRKEFRQARFVAEALRGAFGNSTDEQLLEHPSAQYMLRFAEDPRSVPGHVREEIELHVATCKICEAALELAQRDVEPQAARSGLPAPVEMAARSPLRWLWQPGLAATYLVGLLGLAAWMLIQAGPETSVGASGVTPAPQLVFADPLYRTDGDEPEPLRLEHAGPTAGKLHLLVQTDLTDLATGPGPNLLTIVDSAGLMRVEMDVPPDSVNRFGTFSVVLNIEDLVPETVYELQLSSNAQIVFQRRFVMDQGAR